METFYCIFCHKKKVEVHTLVKSNGSFVYWVECAKCRFMSPSHPQKKEAISEYKRVLAETFRSESPPTETVQINPEWSL